MARPKEAGKYLLNGFSPQQIAAQMGISFGSVRQYLCMLVGEGTLCRSDLAFSIPERHLIDEAIRKVPTESVYTTLSKQGHKISRDLIDFYLIVRDPRPDLYALIGAIEVGLHGTVKKTLESSYGQGWWREGISESIRVSCLTRREADSVPLDDPFHYTNFIDLKTVIDKNWRIFEAALPEALASKSETMARLQTANSIRNRIMHPIKDLTDFESDYRFLRKLESDLRS